MGRDPGPGAEPSAACQRAEPGRAGWRQVLWWLVPVACGWVWFCTVAAAAQERVLGLRCVEAYAFSAVNQMAWSFSQLGFFQQTIHTGYADSWIWSAHRPVWFFAVAWLYGLKPEPLTLCLVQVAAVALGALPAFGLGWRALGGPWGGVVALALYLGYPPLAALALNDYQDLVLGVPLAVAAVHQAWRGSSWGFCLAVLGTVATREEWAGPALFLGLLAPGSFRCRLPWAARGAAVVVAFSALVWLFCPTYSGQGNPVFLHARNWLQGLPSPGFWQDLASYTAWFLLPTRNVQPHLPPSAWQAGSMITRSWAEVTGFYLPFLLPVQLVGVLAPTALVPAAGVLAFHLVTPAGAGVEARWQGHIHHMAPVAAMVVLASILAVGYAWRRTGGSSRLWIPLALVALLLSAEVDQQWADRLGLRLRLWPASRESVQAAPEWSLVARLPADAPIATDLQACLAISSRRLCYTYPESLRDKANGQGLRAVEYLLVNKADRAWVEQAQRQPGARLVGETPGYLLFRMPWKVDPAEG